MYPEIGASLEYLAQVGLYWRVTAVQYEDPVTECLCY